MNCISRYGNDYIKKGTRVFVRKMNNYGFQQYVFGIYSEDRESYLCEETVSNDPDIIFEFYPEIAKQREENINKILNDGL